MVARMRRQAASRTKRKRGYYRNMRVEYVVVYADRLLNHIRGHYAEVVSFTREDLLHLPALEFDQVGTSTRYRNTCVAVAYLLEHGELVQKKFPDLCLPEQAGRYSFDETIISTEYAPTIRRLVTTLPREPFVTMQVVQQWRSDPQLTTDSKRKAVRNAIRVLVREGVCRKLSDFEFVLVPGSET